MTFSPVTSGGGEAGAVIPPLVPSEGWNVLHLFYSIAHGAWRENGAQRRRESLTRLSELVAEVRSRPNTQLLMFSMVSPKADIGFMLLADDLQYANAVEKQLGVALGPDVLEPVFSYYSLTELSEYTTTAEEHARTLESEQGLVPGSAAFNEAMEAFRARMKKYERDRLHPNLPDWPAFCFYPMSKRREPGRNWYALPFEERKRLMAGHARTGRAYAGRILQLITGSTGLDDAEWGVSLFAKDIADIKRIVYDMRFDPVSAEYAEFGQFFIGLQLPLAEIFRRNLLLLSD